MSDETENSVGLSTVPSFQSCLEDSHPIPICYTTLCRYVVVS